MGYRGKKRYEDEKLHNEEYCNFTLACRMVQSTGIKIQNKQNGRQTRKHIIWKTE
jgi:hypothetical protein